MSWAAGYEGKKRKTEKGERRIKKVFTVTDPYLPITWQDSIS